MRLSLVAPRAPSGLKIFLAALAIVDDLGAVLVIALFFTSDIAWGALGAAGLILTVLIALNVVGVRRLTPYLMLGVGLWFYVHESGVHATIAGVLLALVIPTRTRINASEFSIKARGMLAQFDRSETGDLRVLTSKGQQEAIVGLERASAHVTAPLLRLEHALHGFSAFVVMPLFAFSNAGVDLRATSAGSVTVAVILGLTLGKPLGITAAALAAVRLRLADLPENVSWAALHGCAWLGGIGFTMSLFIATLAFEGTNLLDSAKSGDSGRVFAGRCRRGDRRAPRYSYGTTPGRRPLARVTRTATIGPTGRGERRGRNLSRVSKVTTDDFTYRLPKHSIRIGLRREYSSVRHPHRPRCLPAMASIEGASGPIGVRLIATHGISMALARAGLYTFWIQRIPGRARRRSSVSRPDQVVTTISELAPLIR